MADSYKLTVLKRLTALLEGTVVSTYTYSDPSITSPATMAGFVFRGRARFGDDAPEWMLSILESPRAGQSIFGGQNEEARHDKWDLILQGWCPEDKANPTDPIYGLLDDAEKRLDRITRLGDGGYPKYPEHYMLGDGATFGLNSLITSFRVSQSVVRPPTENISSKSFFYVPLQVGLARISS